MIDHNRRVQLADDVLRRFASAVRAAQLYARAHPLVARSVSQFAEGLTLILGQQRTITIGVVGGEFVVGEVPLPRASALMGDMLRRLQRAGVERVVFDREVGQDEIVTLVHALASLEPSGPEQPPIPALPHIQVGRIQVEQRVETTVADMATIRRVYTDASGVAQQLWDIASTEGRPDPHQTATVVDTLAQAVAQNRTALLALTALRNYDNYTFTHMVNVSILTMAQARALGIEGTVLREFGLAGLMHDIGKVRTPAEVLNKPDQLTPGEFEVMKRHVVDGAEILRRTPEIPTIAAMVAFEHHLRIDGTGYPGGVSRGQLNLATQICGIADVYDAMRSQRKYQQASPSERILTVLQRNDGSQFDQRLVRRFVQIIGIYPVGNVVRLDTGDTAVVLRANPEDPHKPQVRVVIDPAGRKYLRPYDVDLLQSQPGGRWPCSVTAPVDPATVSIDPLALL